MGFTIVAAYTPSYVETLRYCLPSWRNSGASKIVLEQLPDITGPKETAWYDGTAARCEAHYRNITAALDRGERVLALDVDCVVLKDLSSGFSADHPISVARWPDFNMGVMFFNPSSPLRHPAFDHLPPPIDWLEWVRSVTDRIRDNCQRYKGTLRPAGGCWLADQMAWQSEVQEIQSSVNKLDADVWNFCPHLNDWEREWERVKDRVKIVHLKGQGQSEKHGLPKRLLQRDFPELL
jgi:hypothetical protein